MNEKENNTLPRKPKTSKLAIASLIFGVLGISIFGATSILFPWELEKVTLYMVYMCLVVLLSLGLGIAGLIRIKRSNSQLSGHVLAAFGIISASVSATSMLVVWLRCCQEAEIRAQCSTNVGRHICIGLHCYSNDHLGKYPSPDNWCDSLEKGNYILRGRLRCPGDKKGPCSYAINPHCGPNSPNDVVLLFETKGGWNQFGGLEILTTENHRGTGCNILFNDTHVEFVKREQLKELKWKAEENTTVANARRPNEDKELNYWLENMVWYHRFTNEEMKAATGLTEKEIIAALKKFDIRPDNRPKRANDAPLLVLPYPGGRHPRIGFLDGAIDPQRETKFSVFTPWDANSYVVADVPEAIWSNLGLTYLAHTHIDTIWTKQGIELPELEWNRHPDGTLDIERKLPNGIVFGVKVKPTKEAVYMELWLKNSTSQKLSDLRVQNCVMTKMAAGFEQQTNDNKVLTNPYVACKSIDGRKWIITAWENCNNPWGNDKCPCFHSDPKFPDLESGRTHRLHGWLSFYEGKDIKAEFKRIEATGWRQKQAQRNETKSN